MSLDYTSNSILWTDSSPDRDIFLVTKLLKNARFKGEYLNEALTDVLSTIRSEKWQSKYHDRGFVFASFYADPIKIADIQFTLYSQAMDGLYYLESQDANMTSYSHEFDYLFNLYFDKHLPPVTKSELRIIRNNVMHTATITGIDPRNKAKDVKSMVKFQVAYYPNENYKRAAYFMSRSHNFLASHIVLRALGVREDSFRWNGMPPKFLNVFNTT